MLVGILNVTPDSFSDGGDFLDVDEAVAAGEAMISEGATIIDVGGESTRPGARTVPAVEEADRVLPVVKGLVDRGVPVSIDTSKPEVAALAIDSGASVINDVTGFRNPDMIDIAAVSRSGVVVMHMLGDPRTMQNEPRYNDVVDEVKAFVVGQALRLVDAGVDPSAVVIDPGFGFGKTTRHNLELVNRLGEIVASGFPVMLGASRKSTLKTLTGEEDPKRRDGHSAVLTAMGFDRGARLFRVHDVGQSRDALRIAAAIVNPQRWEEWQQD
ncbi:MAG: dihydropteroate synthase [Acidimicrobiia bacterium]